MSARPNTSMLHAALWYAELSYPVFPCAPEQKTPLTEHGLLDATTDTEQIAKWWTQYPDANIAIRTDDLVVIDIDGEDNPWLKDEPNRQAELEIAPLAITPRGGRHYFFRQPANRAWRNTAGRLAPHVDTRANGGYVLVAPSTIEGNPYSWQTGRELSIPPQRLPEPPVWLSRQLDEIAAQNNTHQQAQDIHSGTNPISAGQRNDTLARLAGAMRRVGMTQAEIFAALRQINTDRCQPPLSIPEVERIATSIARYAPDAVSVALIENHWAQDHTQSDQIAPLTVRDLMATHRMLRPPVIYGLLRRGETMNVIAPPKTGKSWLVLALAMTIATGRKWLDTFDTIQGNVLIIDNELHPETLAHRIPQVAECLHIGMHEIAETMYIQSLRGRLRDIFSMRQYFETLAPGQFSLIVLDAFYRFMPRGMDENDNGTMANVYNQVDALADRLGCAFVLIHHATKGNQSAKSVTDVGAGAGSQSRAADTHLVLRPHEEPGAVVLEAAVRSWPPVEPMALRWLFPLWKPAPELNPAALRSEKPRRKPRSPDESTAVLDIQTFVRRYVDETARTIAEIAEVAQISMWRARQFLREAEAARLVVRWPPANPNQPVRFATIPPPG